MPFKWTNLEYYGKKLKAHFTRLDTIIQIYYDKDKWIWTVDELNHYVGYIETMCKIAKQLGMLADQVDTVKRLERIETLIEAIPPEVIAEVKTKLGV